MKHFAQFQRRLGLLAAHLFVVRTFFDDSPYVGVWKMYAFVCGGWLIALAAYIAGIWLGMVLTVKAVEFVGTCLVPVTEGNRRDED